MNLDTKLIHFTKINSKCIIDVDAKCKTIKLLEVNRGEILDDFRYSDAFLNTRPKHDP